MSLYDLDKWFKLFLICVIYLFIYLFIGGFFSKRKTYREEGYTLIKQPTTKKGHIYYYIWYKIDHSNRTKSSKRLDVSCPFNSNEDRRVD